MTHEEINIAIAKHLGWNNCKVLPKPQKYWDVNNVPEMCRIGSPPVAGSCTFPNYCNSLDAMHEAEKVLTEIQWFYYLNELYNVIRLPNQPELQMKQAVNATARQRAEAFLRTLGKWEESK